MWGFRRQAGPEKVQGDWYREASPEDRNEYNAFGPWIQPVGSQDEMPRRFRPWWPAHQGARFLLKVPQNVERRDARPGQDLYRAFLAVHEERLCCCQWDGHQVSETVIPFDQIAVVGLSHTLLLGQFLLLLTDGSSFEFSYNTVSRPLLVEVVDEIRRRMAGDSVQVQPTNGDLDDGLAVENFYFAQLAAEHRRRDPRSRVLYCDEPGQPFADERGRRGLTPGLLVLDNGVERAFITQGAVQRKRFEAKYGHRCLHFPLAHLHGYQFRASSRAGQTLVITASGHAVEFPLFGDPKDGFTPRLG